LRIIHRTVVAHVVRRLPSEIAVTRSKIESRIVREADLVAEVQIELEYADHEWSPFIKPADVEKLDAVRRALRVGDVREATKHAKVYRLMPINAA